MLRLRHRLAQAVAKTVLRAHEAIEHVASVLLHDDAEARFAEGRVFVAHPQAIGARLRDSDIHEGGGAVVLAVDAEQALAGDVVEADHVHHVVAVAVADDLPAGFDVEVLGFDGDGGREAERRLSERGDTRPSDESDRQCDEAAYHARHRGSLQRFRENNVTVKWSQTTSRRVKVEPFGVRRTPVQSDEAPSDRRGVNSSNSNRFISDVFASLGVNKITRLI